MKRISALILGLLLTGVFTFPAWAGTLTTNKFIYKPSLGARGDTEKKNFDASLDRIDARLGKEIWVGDPNYGTTLQDAITAIGTTKKTILRIPAGAWAITSPLNIPANITLKFEDGGYLDLTDLPITDIEGLSRENPCVVTWTGHGLSTGDIVSFSGITQYYDDTHPDWMNLNYIPYTVTKINDNSFSIGINTSAYSAAYVPATDPGKVNACVKINGEIKANRTKIFNYTGKHAALYLYPSSQQIDLYPEWFGAVGDQATDDLQAFDQTIGTAKTKGRGVIHLSRKYKLSDTLSINDINSRKITLRGQGRGTTGFVSYADGYPAVELVGAYECVLEDFGITGNAVSGLPTTLVPSVAILIGRSKAWTTGGAHLFRNLKIDGFFQYGEILSVKASANRFTNLYTVTQSPGGALAANRKFAIGLMFDNTYSIVSRNSFLSTWASGTADNNYFDNCFISHWKASGGTDIPADCAGYLFQKSGPTFFNSVYSQGIASTSPNESDLFRLIDGGSLNLNGCFIESAHRYTFNIVSTSPTTYISDITAIDVRGSSAPTAIIKTDANSILKRCIFQGGSYNSNVDLGGGAVNCTFRAFNGLKSFSSGGTFIGNQVELPDTTTNFDLSTATNIRNNTITDLRTFGAQTTIDGDVRIGQPSFVTPNVLTLNTYKITWAAAAPTTGTYTKGSVIFNTAAAAGGSPGWQCINDVTFGTLNSGATTGSITSGTKLLTVNSVTGLKIGDFIDVVADGGGLAVNTGRIVNINTTTKVVTLAGNATANATGTAVSFHNHTTAEAFSPMASTLARTSGVTGAIATGTAVTHGLGTTPTKVLLTPADAGAGDFYVSTLGATTFAVNFAGGGSHIFYWEAIQ